MTNTKLNIHQSNTNFPQIVDIFPKNLPNTGAITFVKGTNFKSVKRMKKNFFCVVNKVKRLAKIISDNKIKCLINEIRIADGNNNEFVLSFLLDNMVFPKKFKVKFYGIFHIIPRNGPINHAMNVIYTIENHK